MRIIGKEANIVSLVKGRAERDLQRRQERDLKGVR
jgi:hypothetical protein